MYVFMMHVFMMHVFVMHVFVLYVFVMHKIVISVFIAVVFRSPNSIAWKFGGLRENPKNNYLKSDSDELFSKGSPIM